MYVHELLHYCVAGPSCTSMNSYMIVGEMVLMIAGLFNLLVLYLGREGQFVEAVL